MNYCVKCDTRETSDKEFCPTCGDKLVEAPQCECGEEIDYGSKFCPYCGKPLKNRKEYANNQERIK